MSITLGRILLEYVVDDTPDGPQVLIDLPDPTLIPVVIQLGMLDLARDTILHGDQP